MNDTIKDPEQGGEDLLACEIADKALEAAAEYYLQIENFKAAQVLENHIESLVDGTQSDDSVEFQNRSRAR